MTLGQRLRELRLARDLTLVHLASLCHVHHAHLSGVERGTRNPSFPLLMTIARVYDMTIGDMLLDVDEWGTITHRAFAPGLMDLCDDPSIGSELTPAWLSLLSKIELDGTRPQTKRDWLEIYLHLKRILEKETA